MKIAVCYWGMTRSTKFVYSSHEKYLYDILKKGNIDYDIFMHTWKIEGDVNIIWENISPIKVDYEEYKLLNPTFYKIDTQCDFLNTIHFPDYFYEDLYRMYGEQAEWRPQLILNHLCALESQRRVYNMVVEESTRKKYDFIMFIRPDMLLLNEFNVDWLNSSYDITVLGYENWSGINDRFAIIPFEKAGKYAERIMEIKEFRKTNGRIVSEKYVKYIVDKYYSTVGQINFLMKLVRPDGQIL